MGADEAGAAEDGDLEAADRRVFTWLWARLRALRRSDAAATGDALAGLDHPAPCGTGQAGAILRQRPVERRDAAGDAAKERIAARSELGERQPVRDEVARA